MAAEESYETDTKVISNNFNRNKERCQEGKHYISLGGQEKNEFVDRGQFDRGLKNAKIIYLWKEKKNESLYNHHQIEDSYIRRTGD